MFVVAGVVVALQALFAPDLDDVGQLEPLRGIRIQQLPEKLLTS